MTQTLTDKVVLVTGASRGIGAGIAKVLAQEGARVVIHYNTNKERADEVKREIDAYGNHPACIVQADVGDLTAVNNMIGLVQESFGRLDILVNNAGTKGPLGALDAVPLVELEQVMKTNFWGPVYTTRAALPLMKENKYGRLVFVSVELVERPAIKLAGYATSKAALNALARSVAVEYGADGITANIITPGPTDTDLNHKVVDIYNTDPSLVRDHFMIPRLAPPEAIGEAVAMVCKNPYITAQNIFVDNGYQRKYIIPRARKQP